ncbi:MAG TPA: hypothetical protein VLN61_04780 [Pseudolabrys sp.]|nr:hypothetical protein [Pseudolabrys sp.]
MSLFLAWHTLAMAVAPAPDSSVIVQSLRPLLQPYLTLFYLDNNWGFYAPTIDLGQQFRYVIEDGAGQRHAFVPTDERNWFLPDYWWFWQWYTAIMNSPTVFGDFATAWLCQKYASLHPVSVTLLGIEEKYFSREDYLNGKHPMDSEFVTVNTLTTAECRH